MNPNIVNVLVSQILAAAPSTLQQTGAIVSFGSSTLTAGTTALLNQPSDFKDIKSADTSKEVENAVNVFFAQGNTQAVYILELGESLLVKDQVAALAAYIADPTLRFYTYLVPTAWNGNADFIQLARLHSSSTSMLYFFIDSELPENINLPTSSPYQGIKSVISVIRSGVDENDAAALMWQFISSDPSEVNKVAPFAFRYAFGVTPLKQKASVLKSLLSHNINYIGVGAEGGISATIFFGGCTSDGKDMMQWYAVDWVQINVALRLANTVINGSNTPQNPLYYDQSGINRLQAAAQVEMNSATAFGLSNGNPTVKTIPFKEYISNHPGDYAIGKYSGVYVTFVPNRGFTQITFNLTVDFSGLSLLTAA